MPLTELPFHLPGRIFRSPMPFGDYDPHGEAVAKFKQERVSVIVLLAEDAECLQKAKRHLRDLYAREGFQVIYLPIPDFSVPSKDELEPVITSIIELARRGRNIAIHCRGGRA